MEQYERIMEAVDFIKKNCPLLPQVGVVLGSGLGEFAAAVNEPTVIAYADIPHFKKVSVAGHAGRLVLGKVGAMPVAVLQGRYHYYEGHDIVDVVFPVRVLAKLGVQSLLLTNAAGGINRKLRPGDLMVIRDHINLMGVNPLRGANDERLGPRFPDMSAVYDSEISGYHRRRPERDRPGGQKGRLRGIERAFLRNPGRDRHAGLNGRRCRGHVHGARSRLRAAHGPARGRHLLRHQPGRRHLGSAPQPQGSDRDGRAGEGGFHQAADARCAAPGLKQSRTWRRAGVTSDSVFGRRFKVDGQKKANRRLKFQIPNSK